MPPKTGVMPQQETLNLDADSELLPLSQEAQPVPCLRTRPTPKPHMCVHTCKLVHLCCPSPGAHTAELELYLTGSRKDLSYPPTSLGCFLLLLALFLLYFFSEAPRAGKNPKCSLLLAKPDLENTVKNLSFGI